MSKKKIAIFASGWAIDYVRRVILGAKSTAELYDTDIYVFSCYRFIDQLHNVNLTTYNIFSIIDYKEFDGVIFLTNIINEPDILYNEVKRIKKNGIPAISLIQKLEGIDFLASDESVGLYSLLQHTHDVHHCTKYAYIGGPDNTSESQNRYNIFKKFLKDNNLTKSTTQIFTNGDYSIDFAKKVTREILEEPDNLPEIIVCVNDQAALTSMSVLIENGIKVPEQVKVIGFDNEKLTRQSIPSLSTCDAQGERLGQIAVKKLLGIKDSDSEINTVPSTPIFRQSCGCKNELNQDQYNLFISKHFSEGVFVHFSSHVHHFEDVFLCTEVTSDLFEELGKFYEKSHYFEGENFSIQLKQDYVNAFLLSDTAYKTSGYIDGDVISIVQIKDGKKEPVETFDSKQIIPSQLVDTKPCLYYILPVVYLDSLIGYCVYKDTFKMLIRKRGYNWMRNLGNQLETFKQKSSYKLLSEKYFEISTIDALSGVLNRHGYDTIASNLYENNKKNNISSLIFFIDINYMKKINDEFGHLQGDFAVKTVAESILSSIPKGWVVSRYGGDEFVIVGSGNAISIDEFTKRFNSSLSKTTDSLKLPYELTVSIGAKTFTPSSGENLNEATVIVDKLMYQNKKIFHASKEKI